MIHKHQFVWASRVEKPRPGASSMHSTIEGSSYVCIDPECGAVRLVWSHGPVEVVAEGLPDKEELE